MYMYVHVRICILHYCVVSGTRYCAPALGEMTSSSRENVRKLIQQYFLQLTQGCGRDACSNSACATGSGQPMSPTDAATRALALSTSHSKGQSKLCAAGGETDPKSSAVDSSNDTETVASCTSPTSQPVGGTAFLQKLNHISAVKARHKKTVAVSISAQLPSSDQTTRFDKSGRPEACPISSLDAALKWVSGQDDLCVPSVPLRSQPHALQDSSAPRMLICHDMMGGYKKDRFVQGHSELEDYFFYHWQYVEAFIYFSHHFLSLPPPCWTNAAHRNGRLSLGTIITEWKDGAKLCARLLSSEDTVMLLAQQMVAMAQYYRFDGWLVNIENPINPMLMDRLYTFLSLLTTGMHEVSPGSKVIWYDSVTVDGNLKWQNSLNKLNQPFFDLCDGIFLNYGWSVPLLQASAALAGDRRGDVYVGVDVFGRDCYGGGGYNTNKALAVVQKASLSAAMFAPGWVYETQDKSHFFDSQDKFWSLLDRYCPPGEPHCLPVVSSFGRGCGQMLCVDGKQVHQGQWTNLSAQDLQPSFFSSMLRNNAKSGVYLDHAEVDCSAAYNGSASLKLSGRVLSVSSNVPATARLFRTAIDPNTLLVSYTVLEEGSHSVSHCLQLQTTSNVLLLDPATRCTGKGSLYDLSASGDLPLPAEWPNSALCRLGALPSPHRDTIHQIFTGSSIQPAGKWKTEYFVIAKDYLKGPVTTVGLAVLPPSSDTQQSAQDFTLNLGEIKILDVRCLSPEERPSYIHNLHCMDITTSADSTISLTLKWTVSNNPVDPISHCNVYATSLLGGAAEAEGASWTGERIYLGSAYASCYRVHGMHMLSSDLKEQPFGLGFRVQSVTMGRRKPSVDDADSITVWFNQ